ncbi:MAG: hypothetical protein ACT6RN_24430 [Agrobacterium sp.]|uniref:hypothetical protein n=1 Tax=Agrobacterium TaxID=357 RepID=UPI0028982727|nr:hypothetical protein [Agrobacterium pusense]
MEPELDLAAICDEQVPITRIKGDCFILKIRRDHIGVTSPINRACGKSSVLQKA